jgi:flavin reductase (DIM6/NTAB) family NADH-FMN oxidoreductase RutF
MKLKQFTLFDLESMEQRFRTNFINSISGFKSVALIGTTDSKSQTNLAIFSSIIHIGANPPLLGFVVRPDSVERHTLENIFRNKRVHH